MTLYWFFSRIYLHLPAAERPVCTGSSSHFTYATKYCYKIGCNINGGLITSESELAKDTLYFIVWCLFWVQLILLYCMAVTETKNKSDFKLTKNTPYLTLTGELWAVYCEHFWELWLSQQHHTALSSQTAPVPASTRMSAVLSLHSSLPTPSSTNHHMQCGHREQAIFITTPCRACLCILTKPGPHIFIYVSARP